MSKNFINYLAGSITEIQKENGDKKVVLSKLSEVAVGVNNETLIFKNIDDILEQIDTVICQSNFSSLRLNVDQFTNKFYEYNDDNDSNAVESLIVGCENFVNYPGGCVMYHNSSQILLDCLNIQYMINHNCIPYSITDFDMEKVYRITRSSGEIQDCRIINNTSMIMSKRTGLPVIPLCFSNNSNSNDILSTYDLLDKRIVITDFLKLNNITEFKIQKKFLDIKNYNIPTDYPITSELLNELVEYFNNKLNVYLNMFAMENFKSFASTEINDTHINVKIKN
jgi:hypothetical protein